MIKNHTMKEIICPALISLVLCGMIILQIYLEDLCVRYARLTFYYLPLYRVRIVFCLVWALSARIFIALKRKNSHKGKVGVTLPALASVLIFILVGVLDWVFLTRKLIWNQFFDVLFILSILCVFMRKRLLSEG